MAIRFSDFRRHQWILLNYSRLFFLELSRNYQWLQGQQCGHLILVEEFIKLNVSEAHFEMFMVVIQLGAIMAVVVLYFKELWFQNQKRQKGALERYKNR